MRNSWRGIFPAVTTALHADGSLDLPGFERHIAALAEAGVHGLVVGGSLGENAMLNTGEKLRLIKAASGALGGRVPLLAGVAENTTGAACDFVRAAEGAGADGFMVLPPTHYASDRTETLRHLRTVARSSRCPIMLYNNPIAYRVDVFPEMFAELADEEGIVAIKESSEDVRRITDIQNLVGDRFRIFIGVDDLALEAFTLGAVGWVAGLAGAFPRESVALYRLAMEHRLEEARALYQWFTPLLHLDASVKFVQYIKLAEAMTGMGSEHVRAPRLRLEGVERARVEAIIRHAIETRPALPSF